MAKCRKTRPNAKRVNHVFLTSSQMEMKLFIGTASKIDPPERSNYSNPGVMALPILERELWALLDSGYTQKKAAEILGLREDYVSRTVFSIKGKIQYLADVRALLLQNKEAFLAFMAGNTCKFCEVKNER